MRSGLGSSWVNWFLRQRERECGCVCAHRDAGSGEDEDALLGPQQVDDVVRRVVRAQPLAVAEAGGYVIHRGH